MRMTRRAQDAAFPPSRAAFRAGNASGSGLRGRRWTGNEAGAILRASFPVARGPRSRGNGTRRPRSASRRTGNAARRMGNEIRGAAFAASQGSLTTESKDNGAGLTGLGALLAGAPSFFIGQKGQNGFLARPRPRRPRTREARPAHGSGAAEEAPLWWGARGSPRSFAEGRSWAWPIVGVESVEFKDPKDCKDLKDCKDNRRLSRPCSPCSPLGPWLPRPPSSPGATARSAPRGGGRRCLPRRPWLRRGW